MVYEALGVFGRRDQRKDRCFGKEIMEDESYAWNKTLIGLK
jgi:hypothetical protein